MKELIYRRISYDYMHNEKCFNYKNLLNSRKIAFVLYTYICIVFYRYVGQFQWSDIDLKYSKDLKIRKQVSFFFKVAV